MPRSPQPLDLTDRAALEAWLAETSALVSSLAADSADATMKKPHRRHARSFLRARLRKGFHRLALQLGALDPRPPTGAP
jgi:hypothetical protein